MADEFNGAPERASVKYESDVALEKPRTDVLVNGCAHAPRGRATDSVRVALAVADIRKELVVTGDRQWCRSAWHAVPSRPEPFVKMPLLYERAFGGIDARQADPAQHQAEGRNLCGVGFRGVRSHDPRVHTQVPNVEYPHARQASSDDRPTPGGFSVVARGWQPRLRWAGTFDAQWLDRQWPLMPLDFDPLHNQAAPPDQQSRTLQGGESVVLVNLTPDGLWQFRLPRLDIPVALVRERQTEPSRLKLDTVLIEPEERRVTMTSRLCIPIAQNREALREIGLGHPSRGWSHANRVRKRYVGRGGPGDLHYHL